MQSTNFLRNLPNRMSFFCHVVVIPQDKHGITSDLTKDDLNDLIEYLKTL